MRHRIVSTRVTGPGMITVRDRARQMGELFGLDDVQRTRFVTAVSEIARNTVQYATEGTATFLFDAGASGGAQSVVAEIRDSGPGIKDLAAVLAGRPRADGSVRLGIAGSRRLVDALSVECPPEGGTVVTISMETHRGFRRIGGSDLAALIDKLARRRPQTPLEELEHQNREMLEALDALRAREQDLLRQDERKNQFLSTLAHELRNPMATLHMTLEILQRMELEPKVAHRREVMSRQVDQLISLVDDLMDASRVSQGKLDLNRKRTEVNELVAGALEMSSAAVSAKNHTLTFARSDDDLWILGDAMRLRQVVCNLVQNSARYSPEAGHIRVSVRREDQHAVIDVEDNGIGIAADVLPHVFELFVQGGPAGSNSSAGLGVGLTLVRRLVEGHGGSVFAASEGPGQGSKFCVTLPLTAQRGDALPAFPD
ncbi:ATPase [Caenimonas sedimenti]|uniref:histidine kinase n=1 Tax=Caenimonas sedimenti TaxID=2596921 RepID=A0A562ZP89_9BURK|nr:sensor histidine kinase [Caenimonas sedimenti]TWO69974.1 ATPase [Caenimonas sedimenti]